MNVLNKGGRLDSFRAPLLGNSEMKGAIVRQRSDLILRWAFVRMWFFVRAALFLRDCDCSILLGHSLVEFTKWVMFFGEISF